MLDRMSEVGPDPDHADMALLVADLPHTHALDRLIERHSEPVCVYLLRILHDAEDARDLTLETFVRLHTHRHRFDPSRPFKTWLYSIASNLARDRLRWRRRHPESPLEPESPSGATSTPPNLIDPNSGPDSSLLQSERASAVRDAVNRLPEDLRLAVVLSEFENQSHAAIAEILDCSVKAVEMRLYRARQTLRNHLSRWLLE